MRRITLLVLMLVAVSTVFGQKKGYYTKKVVFPEGISLEEKVKMAAHVVPTKQQLEWNKWEMTAFLHFGINTFTDREWGSGNEDPMLFNPTALDAEQWVKTLKRAGFNLVILTAKHHDGFCLWPTKTTMHNVAHSPWKAGKGDVVKELKAACDKYDMKFGVYLSPWDRNAACYGDSPRYNQFFIEQLTELLTNYGTIHEVWFDGACGEGPNGKKQAYDWELFYRTIAQLQPNAVTAIMGDDVRWVGNEKGMGRPSEWSVTALTPGGLDVKTMNNKKLNINSSSIDLGSRALIDKAQSLYWYPSEVDVSIRPGWFYHKDQDSQVRSLANLMNIYYSSVGYNSVLLLNIPPDTRGLINEHDVERLNEFGDYLKATFSKSSVVKGAKKVAMEVGDTKEYKLEKVPFNIIELQENIAFGQRVEQFSIDAFVDNEWVTIVSGTTIGYKRLIRVPDMVTSKLRLRIVEARGKVNLLSVQAYYGAPIKGDNQADSWRNDAARKAWKLCSTAPFVVDMNQSRTLKGFIYAPLNEVAKTDMAFKYIFYVSVDGEHWEKVATYGEFSNIENNPLPQRVQFLAPVEARFIKIEATSPSGSEARIALDEIGVID